MVTPKPSSSGSSKADAPNFCVFSGASTVSITGNYFLLTKQLLLRSTVNSYRKYTIGCAVPLSLRSQEKEISYSMMAPGRTLEKSPSTKSKSLAGRSFLSHLIVSTSLHQTTIYFCHSNNFYVGSNISKITHVYFFL